ncbi:MAG: hypothetical protein WED06_01440 [Candidatus Paceibacterota bacterium]
MWMTFFIRNSNVSRTDPLKSYDAAVDAARGGPSGANFSVVFLADDPENDRIVLSGTVS